ncbi:MAG: ImmA/IrrE family metallo-endopeptidase [Terriglobia bacterium]|nr:ImmA/IrrE family metallo-endopeptidase [Terriglobia bacterium]
MKRAQYGVTTEALNLIVVRKIYSDEGIRIDNWTFPRTIRAAYMSDDADPSVAINQTLPREPRLFSLVHELKHHYVDRLKIEQGQIKCGDYNENQAIEIGAEVFAAEFIYPESEFLERLQLLKINPGQCTPEDVVRIKRECKACVSYLFLRKRLVRLGFAAAHAFDKIQFQKLEEQLYGPPIYKQEWFRKRRAGAQAN